MAARPSTTGTTAGNLERIVDALENPETYTYEDGKRETRTDREGHTWTYEWYPDGKLESVDGPAPSHDDVTRTTTQAGS